MFVRSPNVALLLVRLTLGLIFFLHGAQKVLGLFGGPGLSGFVQWAAMNGMPKSVALAGSLLEFIFGILLFFGIFADVSILILICVLVFGIYFLELGQDVFNVNFQFEYSFTLILFSLAILIGGSGMLRCKKEGM
ncbi:hypothetical protein A3F66_03790 [candidate division TM6 bacterium RIFCSPHIGHO2_12_FULL_32_22]|nr:MAG: hypothetical protein A3F66_03790 [candidate division TM6 bacterium RIFCSPHIGHO2_12_FULL_32_22]